MLHANSLARMTDSKVTAVNYLFEGISTVPVGGKYTVYGKGQSESFSFHKGYS